MTDTEAPTTADVLSPGYPMTVGARLDEPLNRWLWLVKWLLAIPHIVVLVLLWVVFVVLTIVAGVGIVFTGRYPRGIFDSHVGGGLIGVLALVAGVTLAVKQRYPASIFDFVTGMHRWGWRVVAYAALMRDEYPPFRIDLGPAEPTTTTAPVATVDPE